MRETVERGKRYRGSVFLASNVPHSFTLIYPILEIEKGCEPEKREEKDIEAVSQ